MVVALIALFVALDGPATAARLIDGGSIVRNSITSAEVRDGSLRTSDLSSATVRSLRRPGPLTVGTAQLRPRAVSADKIVDGAVGSSALADKGIRTQDLGDAVVGMGQLAPGAVTPSKLAAGAVGAEAVADGGLQTSDLGDFAGSVSVDFQSFKGNDCQVAKDIVPQPTAPSQNAVISDDVIDVTPAAGWPDPIVVVANPGAGNTLRIVACRIGGDPSATPAGDSDDIDPGPTTFQYVGFDQP